MRILAFLIFFAASVWCWNGLSFVLELSSEERAFLNASHRADLAEQTERLKSLEADALRAKKERIRESAKSALGSGFLVLLGIVILLKRRGRRPITFSLPPNPPNIDALMESVKRHHLTLSHQVTHFYESRRLRCRVARDRLRSSLARLFADPQTTDTSEPRNPSGVTHEP